MRKSIPEKSGTMGAYRDLRVWNEAYELAVEIYKITKDFPDHERYGLTSQMRRASVSVPANIAEGYGRKHPKEYNQFISIALGSCNELEVYLLLSKDLGYIDETAKNRLLEKNLEIGKMLSNLRSTLGKIK
jgi:four helix bundle protein